MSDGDDNDDDKNENTKKNSNIMNNTINELFLRSQIGKEPPDYTKRDQWNKVDRYGININL